jgi:glycosyltransferase involved in cell wall biosynthesis
MVEISVIIPIYNVEKYLKECLDSIVNQTFKDIEIICIDDGSTDDAPRILNEYQNQDSRIKIITQENSGVSVARNNALKIACGKYVYFCDSDDCLEETALNTMYEISEEKNLDLLIFKLIRDDERTGEIDYNYSDMPFLLDIGKDTFTYLDFKDDLFKVDVTVYTKFFKKELIIDKKFPEGLIFEDNAFYADYILDAERIHFHDECLYTKRIREGSIITKASKNHTDIIKINQIISQKFKNKGLYAEFKEELFMRKVDSIYYRFTLIQPRYRQYYYDIMKEDFLNQKQEYETEMNLKQISFYYKNIFESVIQSTTPEEIDLNLKLNRLRYKMKKIKKENRKLKNKNSKLKDLNKEILSSRSWRITAPLRKLKRKFNG